MEAMSATLLTVLAVIIACTGYAAGRLHQWYREGVDRDEAYREGYDTATRSTFSLAARLVGPRRDRSGVRASAVVHAGRAGAPPVVAPGRAQAAPGAGLASVTPLRAAPRHAPSVVSPRSQSPAFFAPSVSTVTPPPAASALSPAAANPAAANPAAAEPAGAEPAAAEPAAAAAAMPSAAASSRPGRHLVPDELVHADTYRLAPGRVARATVHGRPGDAAPDPAARPSVPRPRSS